jgi:lycopene beta-cyclase
VDKPWDIVIVGGGLGGLSLAAELAAPEFAALSVLVLEKRTSYERDRTWSYWTSQAHSYSHLERQRWNSWSVSLQDETHIHQSAQHTYATLDADAFYSAALHTIRSAPHITLRTGCAVASIDIQAQAQTVQLAHGEQVLARVVLDARPPRIASACTLVQQFAGWQVSTERDVFDASSVQLMAFEPHPRGLHFWYILPYSARCALVESTWISHASWQPDYQLELANYITTLCAGSAYIVDYTEQGVLGLQDTGISPTGLGRNGGTLRPATGYAFVNTLQHAKQLAQSLAAQRSNHSKVWQPHAFARPQTEGWMDRVFLDVLARDWQRAPAYFMRMFEAMSADDTVAFLTGQANWRQKLAVVRAMPVLPFASAALSGLKG